MVSHAGKDLPVETLANSTYDESLEAYRLGPGNPTDPSLAHFFTAAEKTGPRDTEQEGSPVETGFRILSEVSQGLGTKWSIVYDLADMRIFVKVFETPVIVGEQKVFLKAPGQSKIKEINVNGFDFSCDLPSKILDLDFDAEGVVNPHFKDYTTEIFLVRAFIFFKCWGLPITLSSEEMTGLAEYPDTFECMNGRE